MLSVPLSSDSLSCCNYCGPSISEVSEKRTQAVQCWRRWKTLQGKWWQIGCHLQPFTHGYLAYFLCNSSSLSTRLMPSCYYSSAVTRGRRVYRIGGLYRSRKQICRALDKSVSFHSPKAPSGNSLFVLLNRPRGFRTECGPVKKRTIRIFTHISHLK